MNQAISITAPQLPKLIDAIAQTPKVQLRFMRTEMSRGLKRLRKLFIQTKLQGPPGIHGGQLAKGKNVSTFVSGKSLKELAGRIGISRILHVHEKGLTISAKGSGMLYLKAKGTKRIIAVVPKVVIPARLGFANLVYRESPALLRKVGEAGKRATETQLKKGLLGHA